MKRSDSRKIQSVKNLTKVEENELSGYLRLGMGKQSLALARRILQRPKLSGKVFEDCYNAIDKFARRPREWRELLGTAYEPLNAGERKKARFNMLVFFDRYVKEPNATLYYAPKQITRSTGIVEILLVWNCWLRLKKMNKLAAAIPLMSDAIRTAAYPSMRSFLANAYARYWALRVEIESVQEEKLLVKMLKKNAV
ncbi:MAG TPA: hypothetical protein VGO57_03865 [Verrucomicrobiae bacterium]|jgi:hypothetical protein